jgi:protein involved in polysaccharide export with SLBB domain
MLNQLPPAQRQEALRALRQFESPSNGSNQLSSITEDLTPILQPTDPADANPYSPEEDPRIEGNSRLVIKFEVPEDIPEIDRQRLEVDQALRQIEGSRYYELDSVGVLSLPGLPEIPLLGLTAEQVELRLGAEPALRDFIVTASILDSTTIGADGLEAFGYEVFESADYGINPVTSGPVPLDYVLGPGDSVRVQLFGNVNDIYEFEVSRDGVLNLPELGPVTVAGLPFSEFREDLNQRVKEVLIGTQVSVTMGQLRTIRVFVLGDANRPGSYVVSSLATLSGVLYRSGGVSRVGSLRNIQLKRSGETVARMDLYDLLLNGDTSGDSRLQPGDVIFISPVGPQVSVSGAVKRPAVYETRGDVSIADAIAMAGGLSADAYPDGARIERIDARQERTVIAMDADSASAASELARGGDVVVIPKVLPDFQSTVLLSGHVHRPGPFQWQRGMRLTNLLSSGLELKPGADSDYILIRRQNPRDRSIEVVSADLTKALDADSSENILLQPRDQVYVFSIAFGRQRVIEPILEELELQARFGRPNPVVSVSGQLRSVGTYPMERGMRISDLIRAGGGLAEAAYSLKAELVRYAVVDGEYRNTEVIDVDLEAVLRGAETSDLVLEEHDNLRISGLPEWDSLWVVTLEGEVTFPGEYRIRRGETLAQILDRAGGLTDAAFPEGAIFLRESLRLREQEQMEVLARRLQSDITTMSLETADTTGSEALSTGRELLAQLRATEAVGRLVIDLEQSRTLTGAGDLAPQMELRDGDRLMVPKNAQEVTVIGETQQNASHLYQPSLSRDDYIEMSGGLTRRADRSLIYIVRASGAVVTSGRSKWFGRADTSTVRPGDTIVVPLETDRIRPLTFWTSVTQILYQAAIAVAAVKTFNN